MNGRAKENENNEVEMMILILVGEIFTTLFNYNKYIYLKVMGFFFLGLEKNICRLLYG